MKMKSYLIVFSFFICSVSLARVQAPSSAELSFLIFNIQKTNNWGWNQNLFDDLILDSDIVLVQEALGDFSNYPAHYEYEFYQSWGDTGLATISHMTPLETKKIVSPSNEPILGTPKVSSVEIYPIVDSIQKLMVINTHGLNFKILARFKEQMNEIFEDIVHHEGPMIWAGDFNTWSPGRWKHLMMLTHKLSLKEVDFANRDEFFFKLDHAFIRGMNIIFAEQLSIDISDHRPLKLVVDIPLD